MKMRIGAAGLTAVSVAGSIPYITPCKGKAITVTGCRGSEGCETWRLPNLLENRLTVGGDVMNLTFPQANLYPQEDS
jgi:hypothetical protein